MIRNIKRHGNINKNGFDYSRLLLIVRCIYLCVNLATICMFIALLSSNMLGTTQHRFSFSFKQLNYFIKIRKVSDATDMSDNLINNQRMNSSSHFSTIWDPGAKYKIFKTIKNTYRLSLNQRSEKNHAKEKVTSIKSKRRSSRASPNKSHDSGFSDSGDSETSSCIQSGYKKSHVSRVYFYSSNESQSRVSIPEFSTNNKVKAVHRTSSHIVSVPDINLTSLTKSGLWVETPSPQINSGKDKQQL